MKANVDNLVPPKIVWRRRPQDPPVLLNEGRGFYGGVPAVLDQCSKAGAVVPAKYNCMMKVQGLSGQQTRNLAPVSHISQNVSAEQITPNVWQDIMDLLLRSPIVLASLISRGMVAALSKLEEVCTTKLSFLVGGQLLYLQSLLGNLPCLIHPIVPTQKLLGFVRALESHGFCSIFLLIAATVSWVPTSMKNWFSSWNFLVEPDVFGQEKGKQKQKV
ncbi:APO protein 4, mitochondrial isoform B [Glycine soja]|uniref:APO protein 4, mitochondrial isoform A n=1 Tax=Glycine soja TaxID=3848 RepID=A0A445HSL4_GLYSO|nr:APO protein 4, mitochondrial isoform A [Glycine soja]RZB76693.1 APO protein 4, mitochondrial isoform B [Glycine soja]